MYYVVWFSICNVITDSGSVNGEQTKYDFGGSSARDV